MTQYHFIDAEKANDRAGCNIRRLCALLQVSRAGYYAWRSRPLSKRAREDMLLLTHIKAEFTASHYSYGRPRMVAELQEKDFNVSHIRVGRLMRDNGIKAVHTRKKRHHRKGIVPSLGFAANILEQDFNAFAPNQKWGVDISYIATSKGWLYLAVVMDLYSRRIVGWHISDRMKRDLALNALKMAIVLRKPAAGLIHHSDRGSQYTSTDYQMLLKQYGIQPSMSGKGNCFDNAAVETFFKTLKAELVWCINFKTREQATRIINDYIMNFHNRRSRHSTLGNISPMMYEKLEQGHIK